VTYWLEPRDDGGNDVTKIDYYLDPDAEDVEALESLVDGTTDAVDDARLQLLKDKFNG
jgi:hypothetical protein